MLSRIKMVIFSCSLIFLSIYLSDLNTLNISTKLKDQKLKRRKLGRDARMDFFFKKTTSSMNKRMKLDWE